MKKTPNNNSAAQKKNPKISPDNPANSAPMKRRPVPNRRRQVTSSVLAACDDEMVALGPKIEVMSIKQLAELSSKAFMFHKGGIKSRLLQLKIPHNELKDLPPALLDIYADLYFEHLSKLKPSDLSFIPQYFVAKGIYNEKIVSVLSALKLADFADLPERLITLIPDMDIAKRLEQIGDDELKKYGKLLHVLSDEKLMSLDDQTLSRLPPSRLVALPRQLTWAILIPAVGGDASIYRATLTHAHAISGLHDKLIEQRTRFPLLLDYEAAFKLLGFVLVKPVSAGLKVKMQRICKMFENNTIFPVANTLSVEQYHRFKSYMVQLALYLGAMSKSEIQNAGKAGYKANEWFRLLNFPRDIEEMCFPGGATTPSALANREAYNAEWKLLEGDDKSLAEFIGKETSVLSKQKEWLKNGNPGLVCKLPKFRNLYEFIEQFIVNNTEFLSKKQADIDFAAAQVVETLSDLFVSTNGDNYLAVAKELVEHKIIATTKQNPVDRKESPKNIFISDFQANILRYILTKQLKSAMEKFEEVSPRQSYDKRQSEENRKVKRLSKLCQKVFEPAFKDWLKFHNSLTLIRSQDNSKVMSTIKQCAQALLLQLDATKYSEEEVIDFLLVLKIHSDQFMFSKDIHLPSFMLQDDFISAYLTENDGKPSVLAALIQHGLPKALDPENLEPLCKLTNKVGTVISFVNSFKSQNPTLKCDDTTLNQLATEIYQTTLKGMVTRQTLREHYCNIDLHFSQLDAQIMDTALTRMSASYTVKVDPLGGIRKQLEVGYKNRKNTFNTGEFSLNELINFGYEHIIDGLINNNDLKQEDRVDEEQINIALKRVSPDLLNSAIKAMVEKSSKRTDGSMGFLSLSSGQFSNKLQLCVSKFEDIALHSEVIGQDEPSTNNTDTIETSNSSHRVLSGVWVTPPSPATDKSQRSSSASILNGDRRKSSDHHNSKSGRTISFISSKRRPPESNDTVVQPTTKNKLK